MSAFPVKLSGMTSPSGQPVRLHDGFHSVRIAGASVYTMVPTRLGDTGTVCTVMWRPCARSTAVNWLAAASGLVIRAITVPRRTEKATSCPFGARLSSFWWRG
jgi:hypothetical protein